MLKYFKLYPYFVAVGFKAKLAYRVDAIIGLFGFLCENAVYFATLFLTIQAIPALDGFTIDMIGFIYGFHLIPKAIDHIFTDQIWQLSNGGITRGLLDKYLLRPLNPLFQLIAEFIQLEGFGELILGAVFIAVFTPRLAISWNFSNISALVVVVIAGMMLFFSIKLIFCSLSFWTKRSIQLVTAMYSLSDFAKYPVTIYHRVIQVFLLYVIPFALVLFMPLKLLFEGKDLWLAAGQAFGFGLVFVLLSLIVWHFGLKRYESSGS